MSKANSIAGSATSHRSPRSKRSNKIYRTPPTPPPEILLEKEKTFVLDSNACSSISTDYSRTNPKLGPVIKPYNSQKDRHANGYFVFHGVDETLSKTGQEKPGCSIDGPVLDRFESDGAGHVYLTLRNQSGAGHSHETIDGHSQFMKGIKPTIGYHGPYGFRRNTPWLRAMPSPFGTASRSPTH
ncbi:sperm microtubule associated protein 1-like [Tubulanus polymorphus]|uniref:sperm microtubule associated protein 1-like n=1 Tax=Tubulanus polymorphus TaxID=672921 RepID=UPI003DA2F0CF